jgi:TusA-related sulfurtransferase
MLRQAMAGLSGGTLEVLVDSGTSRDNCARAAAKAGWQVAAEERPDGGYKLVLTR